MKDIKQFFDNKSVMISPSLLAADFGILNEEISKVENANADMLHLDVMDGHFVPNISFGPPVISAIRPKSSMFFDTHLMISEPSKYAEVFAKAGADLLTFHVEVKEDIKEVIKTIRKANCYVGISLKPKTPAEEIFPYLELIDLVLVMTVEPGFGGQSFMADQLPKISAIRKEINRLNANVILEVDGGIDESTAPLVIDAGANLLVAGTSVFRNKLGIVQALNVLKG